MVNAESILLSCGSYSCPTITEMFGLKNPLPMMSSVNPANSVVVLCSAAKQNCPSIMVNAPISIDSRCPRKRSASHPPIIGVK